MLKLEDIKRGSQIDGLVPNAIATISVAEMVREDADMGIKIGTIRFSIIIDSSVIVIICYT